MAAAMFCRVDILRKRTLRTDNSVFSAPFVNDRHDDMTSIRSQTLYDGL